MMPSICYRLKKALSVHMRTSENITWTNIVGFEVFTAM
jgi:hypothetical protein